MSLINALNIGRSALAVNQAAINVTGNNIANAGNPDYTRQVARVLPSGDARVGGVRIGSGIDLTSVQRQIDEALQGRIRSSVSDDQAAGTLQQWLSRVEAVFNEMGDEDLSTRLSNFFNSWSALAGKPQDPGLRQGVMQAGETLAGWVRSTRADLTDIQEDVRARLSGLVSSANGLAQQVADLNRQIAAAEGGGGAAANGLRDQRDAALKQLAELVDVHTTTGDNGAVNVFIGSDPLVYNGESRGLALVQDTVDGRAVARLTFKVGGGTAGVASGQVGALLSLQNGTIQQTVDELDALAGNLIFELNKLHASGQGTQGYAEVTGTNAVANTAVSLNDARSGLAFTPANGSFVLHVRDKATGLVTSTLVQVDLDGQGAPDTTLDDLRGSIDAVANVSASVSGGRLSIRADSANYEVSFSQDSSGTLAALGINTFFTGSTAADIGVSAAVKANPALLAAARNGEPTDNQVARAIANLQNVALAGLNGATLVGGYEGLIGRVATAAAGARGNAEAATTVRETLEAQREALSGVSLDEEAVNLIRQQRAFQGAARLIAAIDEMMQTVLSLV